MTADGGSVPMTQAARYIRLRCELCGGDTYAIPELMVLYINGTARYEFDCDRCPLRREQIAHPWFATQLIAAGVPIVVQTDVLADQFAADLEDDTAIEDEMGGWEQ